MKCGQQSCGNNRSATQQNPFYLSSDNQGLEESSSKTRSFVNWKLQYAYLFHDFIFGYQDDVSLSQTLSLNMMC